MATQGRPGPRAVLSETRRTDTSQGLLVQVARLKDGQPTPSGLTGWAGEAWSPHAPSLALLESDGSWGPREEHKLAGRWQGAGGAMEAGWAPARPQPGLPTPRHGGVGSPSVTADRVTGQQSQPGGRQLHRLTGPAPRATGTQNPAGLCPSDPENGCVLGGTLDPPSQDTGRHEAQLDHQDRGQLTAAGSELHSPRSPDPTLPPTAVRLGPDRSLAGLQLSQPWNTRDSARVGLSPRGGAPETLAVCHPPETLAACHHTSCSQAPATPRGPITGDVLALHSPGAQGAQARKGGEGGSSHLPPRGRPRIN